MRSIKTFHNIHFNKNKKRDFQPFKDNLSLSVCYLHPHSKYNRSMVLYENRTVLKKKNTENRSIVGKCRVGGERTTKHIFCPTIVVTGST